jgi:subtilisin family serine protease
MYVPIRRGIMKSYRSFPGLFLILFLIFGVSSYSLALEVPVFSPLRYSIDNVQGTAVYTDTVTMSNVVSGEFHLIVQNGSGGANKVDYAEVYVAGKRLVKMKSTKDLMDKKFKLLKNSEMRIQLTGPKNSFVVVSIMAKKLTQVPLVIRMAQTDAQAAMTNALLKIKKKPLFSSHGFVPSGSVISQTPSPGVYVKEKSKASITVSTGPDQSYALLPGAPETPASSAVVNYSSHDRVTDSEIEELAPEVRIIRTKLEIGFTSTATVGQINALLAYIQGTITAMLKGVNQVIVRIPDPETMNALDALIAQIQLNPIVRYVLKSYIPAPAVLPSNVDVVATPSLMNRIDHHLDVRAHAAWNTRNLLTQNYQPPFMIVADRFGDGEPNTDFNLISSRDDFETGKSDIHGYHVLGIIAATFEGSSSERGMATGMYPGKLPLLAPDLTAGFGWDELIVGLPMILELFGGRVIVNTSLEFTCNASNPLDKSCMEPKVLSWIEKVRGSALFATGNTGPGSLENFFLHLTAAGNVRPSAPTDRDATFASPVTAARLLPGLVVPGTTTPLANLTNTLVIEYRDRSPVLLGETPGCRGEYSKYPGDLSAIGTNVFSLTGANAGSGYLTGTSMATPQVAGLAAYLWAIKPGLTPQQIVDILVRTANTSTCGGIDARPLIDAYAAVLALDRNYPDMEVRRAILDLNEDRFFDEKDVEKFLTEFDAANGAKDYSHYDLNGDGLTGGTGTRAFNLDMDYPPTYTSVSQTIEGNSVSFDENSLTDLDILCYYAYSRLYTSDTDKRKDLLKEKCGKEVPWELIFLQSENEVSVGQCDECIKYQSIGGTGPTSPPLPLPANISTTCPPYSGTTETVQAGGGNLTIGFSGSGTRGVSECSPAGAISTMVQSVGVGRMSTPGAYTVSISASPIFNPPDVLPKAGYLWINFGIGNSDWFRYISCTWGYRGVNDNQCCVEDPLGTTTCVPVGPYSVDIEVPQGINTWIGNMDMSGGDYITAVGNSGDISVSDAVISVVPKQ